MSQKMYLVTVEEVLGAPADGFSLEDQLEALQRELETQQKNLYRLREQSAMYGAPIMAPLEIQNQIEATVKMVHRLNVAIAETEAEIELKGGK